MKNKSYCTYCNVKTSFEKIAEFGEWKAVEGYFKEKPNSLAEKEAFTVVFLKEEVRKCLGCDRFHIYCTESTPGMNENDIKKYRFPKIIKRPQPKWIKHLNIEYFQLLGEIYDNFNRDNFISFSICCRTIVDKILTSALGDIGGFEKKLKKYKEAGHLTESQLSTLKLLIESGNASAHRAFSPSSEICEAILDILEVLLQDKVNTNKAKVYADKIPKRGQ
jgi:hypothetical protein